MVEVRKTDGVLTWDLEAMKNCRQKINECCRLLMNGSTAIDNITIPSGETYYISIKSTMVQSIKAAGQTLFNIGSGLLTNELELEDAEKQSEQTINEILDKYFNEGWSLADILNNMSGSFGEDITYDIEHRDDWPMGLMVPSTANDGEAKPLVIFLPGMGGDSWTDSWFETHGVAGAVNNSEYEKFDGYTACLRSNKYSAEQIMDMVEALSKEYNIDKSNIILAGYSEGANTALKIISETDGYFSKGVIISAGTGKDEWLEAIKNSNTEIKGYVGKNNVADGAYNYMMDSFGEYFDVESLDSNHQLMREKAISTDNDGDNRSDLYEWMVGEDFDVEDWINNGYSEKSTTNEPNNTQSTDVKIDKNTTQNSQTTTNTDSEKAEFDKNLKRMKVK